MTNHITKLIENSGKKLTEISEATNIAYPTLSGYNQGIRKPKKDNAENWQNTLMFPSLTLWDLIATHTLHQILKLLQIVSKHLKLVL